MRPLLLICAGLTLSAPGCAKKTGPSPDGSELHGGKPGARSLPIKASDAGRAPRRVLRLLPSSKPQALRVLVHETRRRDAPIDRLPDVKPTVRTSDKEYHLQLTPGQDGQGTQVEYVEQSADSYIPEGSQHHVLIGSQGQVEGFDKLAPPAAVELFQLLFAPALTLPQSDVGTGARWVLESGLSQDRLPIVQKSELELVALDATRVQLRSTAKLEPNAQLPVDHMSAPSSFTDAWSELRSADIELGLESGLPIALGKKSIHHESKHRDFPIWTRFEEESKQVTLRLKDAGTLEVLVETQDRSRVYLSNFTAPHVYVGQHREPNDAARPYRRAVPEIVAHSGSGLQACYAAELTRQPSAAGHLYLHFSLTVGRFRRVEAVVGHELGEQLVRCAAKVLEGIKPDDSDGLGSLKGGVLELWFSPN